MKSPARDGLIESRNSFSRPFGTLVLCCATYPAINRWAILDCPFRDTKPSRIAPPQNISNSPAIAKLKLSANEQTELQLYNIEGGKHHATVGLARRVLERVSVP